MDCKGLETVRRDNCLLVRQTIDTCLRKILIDRNVDSAIEHAKNTISDLLQNKVCRFTKKKKERILCVCVCGIQRKMCFTHTCVLKITNLHI
jgi:DNA polymerase elongation subunit (family B)